jgi:hypothetical protein
MCHWDSILGCFRKPLLVYISACPPRRARLWDNQLGFSWALSWASLRPLGQTLIFPVDSELAPTFDQTLVLPVG